MLFQSFLIKSCLVFVLWIIFGTVSYFCRGNGGFKHNILRRNWKSHGKHKQNFTSRDSGPNFQKDNYAHKKSYCLFISRDTHCAQASNSVIFMHTPLLHKQHVHFPAIQILFSYKNAPKSQSGSHQPLLQDVEDTEDSQNGACLRDKNLI